LKSQLCSLPFNFHLFDGRNFNFVNFRKIHFCFYGMSFVFCVVSNRLAFAGAGGGGLCC
jgi:hypothetical protein